MTAEIVSVGTELLMGQIADTNAQHLGSVLPECGVAHYHRQTVGDNLDRLENALRLALSRADIVFTIGGLGPTQDDLTREGIARALGVPLEKDEVYAEKLRRLWAQRNLPWTESQVRQAMNPAGAQPIENPNGSAPGLLCSSGSKTVIALPGPRGEFVPMVDTFVRPFLSGLSVGSVICSKVLRVCGLGESLVEQSLGDLLNSENPSVAPYAKPGEVHLRVTASAPSRDEAFALIEPVCEQIRAALGSAVYGEDEVGLNEACLKHLKDRELTVCTAESITGGMLAKLLTDPAGGGKTFCGSIVAYVPEVKQAVLGVSKQILEEYGPVSAECAAAMAEGARGVLGADFALSLTGNAGPTVDVDGKPVGLVYVGLASPKGTYTEEHHFRGTREFNRTRACQAALTMLYKELQTTARA